ATDVATSQNDVVLRAYLTRKKKEKSGRVRHLGFGAKSKKVYLGSSSSSGSQVPSNPNLPSWAEFGAKVLEHMDKAMGLSPELEAMRRMFASQQGCGGSASISPTNDENIPRDEDEARNDSEDEEASD
ncbi:hypothetical protein LINPERPRIM_LOCUS37747, partial [Linum perenne]